MAQTTQAGRWKPESPFLELPTAIGEVETTSNGRGAIARADLETPFVAAYALGGQSITDPSAERFAALVAELEDEEFDRAVADIVSELSELWDRRSVGELNGRADMYAERMLREQIAPLIREADAMIDRLSAELNGRPVESLSEAELDTIVNRAAAPSTPMSPAFDHFLKGLGKKLGKAVKAVTKFMPHNLLLGKLKPLIKPLIERVLKMAMGKLPPKLRPMAEQLAKKFLQRGGVGETQIESGDEAAAPITMIQQELDGHVAFLALTRDPTEAEAAIAGLLARPVDDEVVDELNRARARFAADVRRLQAREDPTPLVENFLPAILPALKLGIKVIGRPKVVTFLSGLVSQLIGRFVGPEIAKTLSPAIVDAGLGMLSLETADTASQEAAGYALARTVEETVRRVSEAPEHAFENESLLETYVLEAFDQAAAANLPPALIKPELRETSELTGTFLPLPNAAAPLYEKYTQIPTVTIPPEIAQGIKTFSGVSLQSFLRNQFNIAPGTTVTAKLHIFRAVKGTWLSKISQNEAVLGHDKTERAWSQIHPLTPEAAAVLLKSEKLGEAVAPKFLNDRNLIAEGQRFYFLELGRGPGQHRRASQINVTIDFPRRRVRIFIFLSEARSQDAAARLRDNQPVSGVLKLLRAIWDANRKTIGQHVRVIHEVDPLERAVPAIAARIGAVAGEAAIAWAVEKLLGLLEQALAEYLKNKRDEFIRATEAPADGVTLVVTFTGGTWLDALRGMIAGTVNPMKTLLFPPNIFIAVPDINIVAGFRRG